MYPLAAEAALTTLSSLRSATLGDGSGKLRIGAWLRGCEANDGKEGHLRGVRSEERDGFARPIEAVSSLFSPFTTQMIWLKESALD